MFFTGVVIFESVEELLWEPAPGETNLNKPLGFTLFEEGSELFGTLCFFGAMVVYIYSMAKPISVKSSATIRRLEFSIDQSTALRYTFLLMCLLGLGFAMVEFTGFAAMEGDSGIPQNWFPSAMAALAAILALQLLFSATKPGDIHRYMYYIFTIFTGMLSLYYGANVKGWLIMEEVASYCAGPVISGFLIVGTVFSGVFVVMQTRELWSRVGIGIWVILLSLSFAGSGRDWAAGPLEFFAFAFLLPALVAHFFRERSAETLSV